ncbi:MAG: RNA methyltransferase [Gammaproteobacteria bacterium]|nr:RNA methyltransferase [Gammaproteobacteria bacterium]
MSKLSDRIRIVLIATSHPGNIGAAARAMKTMGLQRLVLVSPKSYPHADATARASGADDVLANAQVCTSLAQALQGCHYVFGLSARERTIPWPQMSPRQCADYAAEQGEAELALVFGREHSGLTNEELEACHYHVSIDANPDYPSLNLAAAVQIMCYELRLASVQPLIKVGSLPAPVDELERFFEHLEQVMIDVEFLDPEQPGHIMRRLRRLYMKAEPDKQDINILRGVFSAAQRALGVQKNRPDNT